MKVVTDLSVASRPLEVGRPFAPGNLFASGDKGFAWSAGEPGAVFLDVAATEHPAFVHSIAVVKSPTGLADMVQSNVALRPLFGRKPVTGRRNLLLHTEDARIHCVVKVSDHSPTNQQGMKQSV